MTNAVRILTIAVVAAGLCAAAAGCSDQTVQTAEPTAATQLASATAPASTAVASSAETDGTATTQPTSQPVPRRFMRKVFTYSVVYLIDASGSMASVLDEIRGEVLKSVSHLQPGTDFTIVLFGRNDYVQGPRLMLLPAEKKNVKAAKKFLVNASASGSTTILPGLKRAFSILKYADPRKDGRIIYLVSDGDFAGLTGGSQYTSAAGKKFRGGQAVIEWLRDNNPKKGKPGHVYINTYLYNGVGPAAEKAMRTIAEENDGRFRIRRTSNPGRDVPCGHSGQFRQGRANIAAVACGLAS